MIVEQLTVGFMGVCCYIVWCDKTRKSIIIDPGGDDQKVIELCGKKKLEVVSIVNTHGHPDHVCGNGAIKKATGAEIIMHEEDASFFSQPEIIHFFSSLGLPQSPPPDRKVKDGDLIRFGEENVKVIHTPGHTPGGICLYAPPHLFTGDTLFAAGVGRTDFPGGSTSLLSTSIKTRLFSLPPETIVWPGHGYGGEKSSIGEEIRGNPFLAG